MEKIDPSISKKNVKYIDMISKVEGIPSNLENVLFLDSPTDYNNLLEVLNKELGSEKSLVVLDNIHSLFLFDDRQRVLIFLKNLFNIVSENENYLISYLIQKSLEEGAEKSALSYVDKIIGGSEAKSIWEEWQSMSLKDLFSLKNPLLFFIYINQLVVIAFLGLVLIYLIW
jgi:archaellum biogenesis ATPase FlaH